jgi:hypothetical protein
MKETGSQFETQKTPCRLAGGGSSVKIYAQPLPRVHVYFWSFRVD